MNFERRKRRGKEFIFFDIVNAKIDDDKYTVDVTISFLALMINEYFISTCK